MQARFNAFIRTYRETGASMDDEPKYLRLLQEVSGGALGGEGGRQGSWMHAWMEAACVCGCPREPREPALVVAGGLLHA